MSATPKLYFRDPEGESWDLSTRLPACFNPTAYEWGTHPAMPGHWPVTFVVWPVCAQGQLTALLPWGHQVLPPWGGTQRVNWYADRPLPKIPSRSPGELQGANFVVIDGLGGLPSRHLMWVIGYDPPQHYIGLHEILGPHDCLGSRLQDLLPAALRMARFWAWVAY